MTTTLPRIMRCGRKNGGCLRCGDDDWDNHHHTQFSPSRSCAPLCESCWSGLTPTQRLVWYEVLLAWWEEDGCNQTDGPMVRAAVLSGL